MIRYLRSVFCLLFFASATLLSAQKLYWVGGSGSFSDARHWSYSSGGVGGANSPDISTDVYFDENSFPSAAVIDIIGNPSCKNLIFSDNTDFITFKGTQNEKLTIGGDAKFNSYIDNKFKGAVYFVSDQTVTSVDLSGFAFSGNAVFEGNTQFIFRSNINIGNDNTLYFNKGYFELNNTGIYAGNFLAGKYDVVINSVLSFINIKHKLDFSDKVVYNDTKTYLRANLTDPSLYYIPATLHFSSQSRFGNEQVLSCVATLNSVTDATCPNGCNGVVIYSLSSGCNNGPYCVTWNNSGCACASPAVDCSIMPGTYTVTNVASCASAYNVIITDADGNFVQSLGPKINSPAQLIINFSKKQPLCNGQCTGLLVANISGGTQPYCIKWTPGPNDCGTVGVDSLKNACAGIYSAVITDANNCVSSTYTSSLSQPNPILANGTSKAPTCFGKCDGSVTVNPSGGTPNTTSPSYTVAWDGNPALNTFTLTGLCASTTHTAAITDKNGCTLTFTISVPAAPAAIAFTKTPATGSLTINCANVCNGILSLNAVSGGTPTYSYTWAGGAGSVSNTSNSSTNSNLCAGTYTATITDANTCSVSTTFTISSPPPITHFTFATNPKCNGLPNGSVKDSLSGGTPGFSFAWSPTGGTVNNTSVVSTYSNIGAGTYTVIGTDTKGCKDTAHITITNPPPLTATLTPSNPTCFGVTNGTICVSPSGGTPGYTYSWTPSVPSPTNCINNVGAGPYTATVTDANGCKTTLTTSLTSPPALTLTVNKKNPSCSTTSNGSATVTPTGGSGSGYTYAWSCAPTNTANIVTGQAGGTSCTVTVTDGNGCAKSQTISFTAPNPLTASLSATPLVCAGDCNSQITSNVTGGTPTYTYSWSGTGATPVCVPCANQTNMCAGNYTLTVTDSAGCQVTSTVSVTAPLSLTTALTFTNPSCAGLCDGSLQGSSGGGTSPYTFSWNPAQSPNANPLHNLCSGVYTFSVTDANGCKSVQTATLTNPAAVTASLSITNVKCAGQCNGSATVTPSGGTPIYTYSWDNSSYGVSPIKSGLCAGTHTIEVKDSKGCLSSIQVFNITQPTALTASVSNVTKSCINICNGTAQASASGGTLPYAYSWDNPLGTYTTNPNISTLCIGTHTLYVQDANGCIASTIFNVQVKINVNIIASSISVSCNGACDGTANATASGGSPPYTFNWLGCSASTVCTNTTSCQASGLCPCTYTVRVTDATGCASQDTLVITNPPVLSSSVSVSPAGCFGSCNGSATVTPSGGTPGYIYTWSNNGGAGPIQSNLCPGTYTVQVTDSRGCASTQSVTVSGNSQFTLTPTVTSPTACTTSTGSATLAVSGGTPTYTVTWLPAGTNPNSLAAGTYTANVVDSKGCDTSIVIGVSDPVGPATSFTVNNNVSCFGLNNGSATVAGTGTNTPITITWPDNTTGASPVTDATLSAGVIPVQVKDANGCISIQNVTITSPTAIKDSAIVVAANCSGTSTGSMTLIASGGTGSYSYTVDGVSTASVVTGLSTGAHTVAVTDNSGCSVSNVYIINSPAALIVSITKTNEICSGSCNGTAKAVVSGGTPGYQYAWNNASGTVFATSPNIGGLCPGAYTVNVSDTKGCLASATVTINAANPIVPNLVKKDNLCNTGCTGSATVSPTGGSGGGFTYAWNTPAPANTGTVVSNLCPGNYFTIITDTSHCQDTARFTITAPATISITVTSSVNPTCFGYFNGSACVSVGGGTPSYSYNWSPNTNNTNCAANLNAGTYVVNVTDSNNCSSSITFTLTSPPKLQANLTPTDPVCFNDCNGIIVSNTSGGTPLAGAPFYNYQWLPTSATGPVVTGLCAGSYTAIIGDSKNCHDTAIVTLNNPSPVNLSSSTSAATCGQSNGSIALSGATGNGTVSVVWLAPSSCGTSLSCNNLAAGIYSVVATDSKGCKDTLAIPVTNSNGAIVNLVTANVSCFGSCNGSATVTASAGTPPYTYSWSPVSGVITPTIGNLCAGPYISIVKDQVPCQTLTSFSISAPPAIQLNPNIINPTCAGINDGSIGVSASGGTPYHDGYVYTINGGLASSHTTTIAYTGLGVGAHTITVTDSLGCTQTVTYTLTGNTFILSQVSHTNNKCFGDCNGTAVISNVNGGTGNYTFQWNDPLGQSSAIATQLCAGNYTATITDGLGCQATQTVTITTPTAAIAVLPTITQPSCGLCNGTISLAPSGGNGPTYTYSWTSGASTPSVSSICAGLYQVEVKDDSGCVATINIPISNSNAPTASVSITNVSCAGKCNGSATVTPSGGTPGYTYNWLPSANTTSVVTGQCADTLYVQVKDNANCVLTQSVVISEPTPIVITQTITQTACGLSTGAVTVSATPIGSYTFNWNGPGTTPTGSVQTSLAAGAYTVIATNGTCSDTVFIPINSSNAPNINVTVTNPLCNGQNNGSAFVNISGGTPGYTVSFNNGPNINPATSLSAGNYNVVVTDNNGCAAVKTFTVTDPATLALSLSNTQLPPCSNVCSGALTALPSGGTLPYTYNWSTGPTTDTIGHLCAGTYSVLVTDAKGCTQSQTSVLANNPTLISANPTITQPGCGFCNGTIVLNPSGGSGGYTYTWSASGGSGPVLNNACAAVYPVTIQDGLGCSANFNIPVSNSSPIITTTAVTNVSCFNKCDGTATVTASNGTGSYTYNWLPTPVSTNSVATGLCHGLYFVEVKDQANCVKIDSVNITTPSQINVLTSVTSPSCNLCNGAINVSASGGSGTYTYNWSPSLSSGSNPTSVCAGSYTLVVNDGTCTDTSLVGVSSSSGPLVAVSVSPVKCFGQTNGSASVLIASPVSTTFVFDDNTSTSPDNNFGSGTHDVTVTDANGCVIVKTFTITEPAPLSLSFNNTQLPACSSVCNGKLTAIPTGGTIPYTYTWSPGNLHTDTIGSLCAGHYVVNVGDANGCTTSMSSDLINNPFLIAVNPTLTQPSCGSCNGTITVSPTGGNAPYSYVWNVPAPDSVASNLCAGVYQVDITDSKGCRQSAQLGLSSSNSPTLTVNVTNASCFGSCNGVATATANGGIQPYVFSWPSFPTDNTNTASGLCATTNTNLPYFVQVKDSAGCIATQSVVVNEPTQLNVTYTTVSPGCGQSNGSIATSVSGGSGIYTYTWSNGANTNPISNIAAGTYSLIVSDGSCNDTLFIALNNPNGPLVSIQASPEKCFGDCNATATLTAIGGAGGNTIAWTNGQSSSTATNLCPQVYGVTVTDASNCAGTATISITEPTKLINSLPTIKPISCYSVCDGAINTLAAGGTLGYSYSWSPSAVSGNNPTGLCGNAAPYSYTITDANGCSVSDTARLTDPLPLALTATVTPASCNTTPDGSIATTPGGGTPTYTLTWMPGSVTSPTLTNVLPNTYSLHVVDSHGCTKDSSFVVTSIITVSVTLPNDTILCTGGTVVLSGTVSPSNATETWITLSNGSTIATNTLTVNVSPAGTETYVLQADVSGCKNSDTVQVVISPAFTVEAGPDQSVLSGQSVTLGGSPTTNVTGGTIVWSPNIALSDTTSANPTASPTNTTEYHVTVTNANGCKASDSVLVTVLPPFTIPTGFTPNGDGKNDTWMLDDIGRFPNVEIEVYNRWGEQLFYSKGAYTPWQGTFKGQPVPVGTYYYIIRLNDPRFPDHYAGPLTILR